MEYQLERSCRVCGGRLKKAANSLKFQSDLLATFRIDVSLDKKGVHPTQFCSSCYLTQSRVSNATNTRIPYMFPAL